MRLRSMRWTVWELWVSASGAWVEDFERSAVEWKAVCADDRRSDLVLESEGSTGFGFAQVVELDGSDRELGLDASSE